MNKNRECKPGSVMHVLSFCDRLPEQEDTDSDSKVEAGQNVR